MVVAVLVVGVQLVGVLEGGQDDEEKASTGNQAKTWSVGFTGHGSIETHGNKRREGGVTTTTTTTTTTTS